MSFRIKWTGQDCELGGVRFAQGENMIDSAAWQHAVAHEPMGISRLLAAGALSFLPLQEGPADGQKFVMEMKTTSKYKPGQGNGSKKGRPGK